ncbi:MAG TPA: alternative ribosome rescue aminoacyl-tRNA hydrolase ArfB [Gemmatimonadaceae bacterium]|nr:alternative ribosome rescue aminoacyl-tRNA hydrolase ArfB [Gemmatimonadaceae bacterium]
MQRTDPGAVLRVTARVAIPRAELDVRATRSGGPGGQHVNTSATRIELLWRPAESRALSEAQRERVLAALAWRLDASGAIRVVASEHRSQRRNRDAAEARLAALIRGALAVRRARVPTRPTRAAVERRLQEKRQRSERKRRRRTREDE